MSKYNVFSGPHFPVFGLNKEIYIQENTNQKKNPYLYIFHVVKTLKNKNIDSRIKILLVLIKMCKNI